MRTEGFPYFCLSKEIDAFDDVNETKLLRGGDDDGRRDLDVLREREVDVASARRHVDNEEVELAPISPLFGKDTSRAG